MGSSRVRLRYMPHVCGAVLALILWAGSADAALRMEHVGLGPKFGLAIVDGLGVGPSFGGHALFRFDMGRAGKFAIYPNIEFWFASEDDYYLFQRDYYDISAFEFSFNADARYYFPIPDRIAFKPYVGLGLALPVVTTIDYDWRGLPSPPYRDRTDIGAGFNMMGGFDIEVSRTFAFFFEMKGKIGDEFEVFKLNCGLTFGIQ